MNGAHITAIQMLENRTAGIWTLPEAGGPAGQ